ncbi:hypothetical protein SDRG_17346, partial [Saprolegnia diclina VS20]
MSSGHLSSLCRQPSRKGVQLFASLNKITSAPITSGRRVALVYALTCDAQSWVPPVIRDDVVEGFATIAQDPPNEVWYVARAVDLNSTTLEVVNLKRLDATFVDLLVATGDYDVALARFADCDVYVYDKYGTAFEVTSEFDAYEEDDDHDGHDKACDDDDGEDDDSWCYMPWYENIIVDFTHHEACNVPDAILWKLECNTADFFLRSRRAGDGRFKLPGAAIVFWPKSRRLTIAEAIGALEMLRDAIECGDVGTLGLGLREFPCRGHDGQLLLQYKDMELLEPFIRDTQHLPLDEANDTARFIHTSLETCSWPALLPAMESFLARAARKSDASAICRLLASLAGLASADDAVCPPLTQPYTGEFLKSCWQAVVIEPEFRPGNAPTEHCILLDWYFDDFLPTRPGDNYLGQWLPPPLLL